MKTFSLKEQEYIELNKLLKILRIVGTGGEAKMRIQDGEAMVNGEVELRVRKKLRKGDKVVFDGEEVVVE